jgi:hypothetical protein
MVTVSQDQIYVIVNLIAGCLVILSALFSRQLQRLMGTKPRSEMFTNPSLQRAEKIIELLGRLLLVVFGLGFLVQGPGSLYLPARATYTLSIIIYGLAGLILLAGLGVYLASWKAK